MLFTKVQKWGNSLAIRIPRGFAEQLKIEHGSEVDLLLDHDHLIMMPSRRRVSLSTLLSQVTKENIHGEVTTGEPTGREVW